MGYLYSNYQERKVKGFRRKKDFNLKFLPGISLREKRTTSSFDAEEFMWLIKKIFEEIFCHFVDFVIVFSDIFTRNRFKYS